MARYSKPGPRRGAAAMEFAVVGSVSFFLMFALIVGALGVFRYQEVAHLAREGARYASTHGGKYQQDGIASSSGVSAVASSSDLRTYLLTRVVAMDPSKLQVSASWSPPAGSSPTNMPTYADTTTTPPGEKTIRNYVTVTVSYTWMPEFYLVGPYTLSSTSTVAMQY